MIISHYDFASINANDKQMAECLEMKGDWKAVSRDSAEWRKAKLENSRRNLQKAVDKLQDPSEEP
jgi:hypothetical protein